MIGGGDDPVLAATSIEQSLRTPPGHQQGTSQAGRYPGSSRKFKNR